MAQSVSCPSCKSDCEDTIHALWGYPALRIIWEVDGLSKNLLKYKLSKLADLLELIFSDLVSANMDLLAVIF